MIEDRFTVFFAIISVYGLSLDLHLKKNAPALKMPHVILLQLIFKQLQGESIDDLRETFH